METSKTPLVDLEELWRRVGLTELRQALGRAQTAIERFEETLKKLPSCDECARDSLLEQIRAASNEVGIEAVSLSVLAETLEGAVSAAECAHEGLKAGAPDPCECGAGECTCHG